MQHRLFVPRTRASQAPLVVALHGCTQTAESFARSTGFDAAAERYGALVLYPEQSTTANPSRCWNWFLREHQDRSAGEPAAILALIADVVRRQDVDASRVFVCGLSAGGAMAAILADQAPDVFAAAGISAGVPLRAAATLDDAYHAMAGRSVPALGERPRASEFARMRVTIWTGADDRVVAPSNATELALQFAALMGLDGSAPAPAFDGGAALLRWHDAGGATRVETRTIAGMGHAWSGGAAGMPFTHPRGPSASDAMLAFFLAGA